VRIILSPDAEKTYKYFSEKALVYKSDKMMIRAILYKMDFIIKDHNYGNPIRKDMLPAEYVQRYGIKNLYRVELLNFWRMLYSINDDGDIEIIAFVLDIIDHKTYNKKFGYRKG